MQEHITVPSQLPGRSAQDGIGAAGNGSQQDQGYAAETADQTGAPANGADQPPDDNDGIIGISVLRGLLLYAAVLTFVGLFVYFIVVISTSKSGVKPSIDATLISAAAALSGVLGSAFALKIGVKPNPALVNSALAQRKESGTHQVSTGVRTALSLEPRDTSSKSWPLTFGIWAYAAVASAVVVVYILNQNETPGTVKALAITFGGYVIALINVAYNMGQP